MTSPMSASNSVGTVAVKHRNPTLIIVSAALAVVLAMGIRLSFGLFLRPISESLGVGREVFSLAMAVQNIMFGLPLAPILADRFGTRWVVVIGGAGRLGDSLHRRRNPDHRACPLHYY